MAALLVVLLLLVAPSDCSVVLLPICSAAGSRSLDSNRVPLRPMESISFPIPLQIALAADPSRSPDPCATLSRSLRRCLPSPGRPLDPGRLQVTRRITQACRSPWRESTSYHCSAAPFGPCWPAPLYVHLLAVGCCCSGCVASTWAAALLILLFRCS
jgi:hypothetical protein